MKSCRRCKFLDVPPNSAGKKIARKWSVYECTWNVEPMDLPASITRYHSFRWPPSRMHMGPNDGEDCPCFVSLTAHERNK